jgi:hypothetical protein
VVVVDLDFGSERVCDLGRDRDHTVEVDDELLTILVPTTNCLLKPGDFLAGTGNSKANIHIV